jgi:hypothetical protein
MAAIRPLNGSLGGLALTADDEMHDVVQEGAIFFDPQARLADVTECVAVDVRVYETHREWVQQVKQASEQGMTGSYVLQQHHAAVRLDHTIDFRS